MKKIAVIIGAMLALGMGRPAGVTAEGDQTTFHRLDAAARAQERVRHATADPLTEDARRARISALLMMFNTSSGLDGVKLLLR